MADSHWFAFSEVMQPSTPAMKAIQNAHLHGQPSVDGAFPALADTNDEIAQSVRISLRVQEGYGNLSTSPHTGTETLFS